MVWSHLSSRVKVTKGMAQLHGLCQPVQEHEVRDRHCWQAIWYVNSQVTKHSGLQHGITRIIDRVHMQLKA